MLTATDDAWMGRALELAEQSPWPNPNPQVGCVVLDALGRLAGEGFHRGAGTAHAEVAALAAAGERARGGTAYVTLEPCAHTGRTGPCTAALVDAGVVRVVYAQTDPHAAAAGGGDVLRAKGIEVVPGVRAAEAADVNARWTRTIALGRPLVTWKFAATLDGRSAAADRSSQWITGEEARADVHALRASRDAIVAGTGTVLVDDPRLTARPVGRMPLGSVPTAQPRRVVVGLRDVPASARVFAGPGDVIQVRSHDPAEVLAVLWDEGLRDVWLEGGPTLAAAFLRAGLVDEIYAYVAPALLGSGRSAVGDLGIGSIDQLSRFSLEDVRRVGGDVRIHVTNPHAVGAPRRHQERVGVSASVGAWKE